DGIRDFHVTGVQTCALPIWEVDADAKIKADLAAFWRDRGVDGEALAAMVERGPARLLMYRTMVQSRLRRVIREFLPSTAARLGRSEERRVGQASRTGGRAWR